jgi:hypothetical protein
MDCAANYPDGVCARLLEARRAAHARDASGVAEALNAAADRGYDRFADIIGDPVYAPFGADPAVQGVVAAMAQRWIDRLATQNSLSQKQRYTLAIAYRLNDDLDSAHAQLERALAQGGPIDDVVRDALAQLARLEAGDGAGNEGPEP